MRFLYFLFVWFIVAVPVVAQDAFKGKVTEIERGDQLTVTLDSWGLKVRLHGVECPTQGELASVALEWTKNRVWQHAVQVAVRGTAAKGVVYGDVAYFPGAHNLSIELMEQGLATWAQRYAPQRRDLDAAQERARKARAGLWGNPEVEVIRIRQLMLQWRKETKSTPRPVALPKPTASPRPTAIPSPRPQSRVMVKRTSQPILIWPIFFGILLGAILLALAERVSRDARRLRQRPVLLADTGNRADTLKLRGIAHAQGPLVASIAGRIPGLYIHEISQVFRDGSWCTTYDETDTVPFVLDDGSGQGMIRGKNCRYHPIRVARFYNDIPVEKWHIGSYGGDVRTEVFFIPSEVTLVCYGQLSDDRKQPMLVIEGDERRLTHLPVRLAMGLISSAIVALLLGSYFTISGGG